MSEEGVLDEADLDPEALAALEEEEQAMTEALEQAGPQEGEYEGDGEADDWSGGEDWDVASTKKTQVRVSGQTKEDRELSTGAHWLSANKEAVNKTVEMEADVVDVPDLEGVKLPRLTLREAQSKHEMEVSMEATRYDEDLARLAVMQEMNRFMGTPIYPGIDPEMDASKLTATDLHRLVLLAEMRYKAANKINDELAGALLTREAMMMGGGWIEGYAPEWGYKSRGFQRNFGSALDEQPRLPHGLYMRYIRPTLAKLTGGRVGAVTEIGNLALLLKQTMDKTHAENERREGVTRARTRTETVFDSARESAGPEPVGEGVTEGVPIFSDVGEKAGDETTAIAVATSSRHEESLKDYMQMMTAVKAPGGVSSTPPPLGDTWDNG